MDTPRFCDKVSILGAQLSLCDKAELLAIIAEAITTERKLTILSGNIHAYNLAYEHPWLRAFFNQVDIVRLDGEGVRLGARLLGHSTPQRMTWADFAWDLAQSAARQGHSLFLLGGRPGVAYEAGCKLQDHYPSLRIVGAHHGYFDKALHSAGTQAVMRSVAIAKPDILIVGFGMPLQERWLVKTRDLLAATVVLTGGAVFDYVSGELQRGPSWMTSHGLEWLARLIIEPKRLWRRYIIGNPVFFYRILLQRFRVICA